MAKTTLIPFHCLRSGIEARSREATRPLRVRSRSMAARQRRVFSVVVGSFKETSGGCWNNEYIGTLLGETRRRALQGVAILPPRLTRLRCEFAGNGLSRVPLSADLFRRIATQ